MADIHQTITLGIGTPSDIPHLTLFGLSPTGPVDILQGEPTWTVTVQAQNRTITVPAQIRTITVAAPTRTTEV